MMTMRVADDDDVGCVGVAPRRLGSALRACRARRLPRAAHVWREEYRGVTECGYGESRTTNVADHGHDLDRVAVGVLLVPVC